MSVSWMNKLKTSYSLFNVRFGGGERITKGEEKIKQEANEQRRWIKEKHYIFSVKNNRSKQASIVTNDFLLRIHDSIAWQQSNKHNKQQ